MMAKLRIIKSIMISGMLAVCMVAGAGQSDGRIAATSSLEYLSNFIDDIPIGIPTPGKISLAYGWHRRLVRVTSWKDEIKYFFHPGCDIPSWRGSAIRATASGVVVYDDYEPGYGNSLKIRHRYGFETFYGHCSEIIFHTGQRVKKGDIIALAGATGNATGNVLHYEIFLDGNQIDPGLYLIKVDELKNTAYSCSNLHLAVIQRDYNKIQKLLKNGVNKNAVDDLGFTPYKLAEILDDVTGKEYLK